ncbi:MAG: transcriptional repressor [Chloroflexi bacterium]|nr:transcriptional repressor [Chloroflexota bacterium]
MDSGAPGSRGSAFGPSEGTERRSQQREAILDELRRVKTHPRSDELYLLVRQRLPHVSLGTVYRNLDRLQREGLAQEIYCGDFVRYDGDTSPHDHFLCDGCRQVWDFGAGRRSGPEGVAVETPWQGVSTEPGFQIDGCYTVFYGLCAECRSRQSSTESL